MINEDELAELIEWRRNRFRVLVCIDGSEDSYKGLSYAAKLARAPDADIILLYVRPIDQGMRTGGLEVRVARENMMNWGLELPGIQYLKRGRDMLVADEELSANWNEKSTHTDLEGDPLGDNKIEYTNEQGKSIVLKLKTSTSIATGILDQYELGPYDMIILGASESWSGPVKGFWDPAVAEKVAIHAPCSVLVVRDLTQGEGHLVCTDGSDKSFEMIKTEADFAVRGSTPVSVLSVALDAESEPTAQRYVARAREILENAGAKVVNAFTRIGNPVEEIIDAGRDYQVIVVADEGRTGLQRFFMGSVAFQVMEHADRSVLVVR